MRPRVRAASALARQGVFTPGMSYDTIPTILSSAAVDNLIAVDATHVLYADEGQGEIETSGNATVGMDTTPDDRMKGQPKRCPSSSGISLASWSSDMNWEAKSGAVRAIKGVTY